MRGDRWRYSGAESSSSSREQNHTLDFVREKASSSSEETSDSGSDSDDDTATKNLKAFKRTYKTNIFKHKSYKDIFLVESESKAGIGIHQNIIDINEGKIIGRGNFKDKTNDWYFSDIIYSQIQLAMKKAKRNVSQFDLKTWYGEKILDKETKSTIERIFPRGMQRTFKEHDEEFNVLKQLPTAKSKSYLIDQHPEAFPEKRLTSITVIRRSNDNHFDISYEFGS